MPRAKNQTSRRIKTECLTELYNQLQAVLLLQEVFHPKEIGEAVQPYAPLPPDDSPRYCFEKRGKESWAVLDRHQGNALVVLTKYKTGALAVVERLEAYERRIANLSQGTPVEPSGVNGRIAAFQPSLS